MTNATTQLFIDLVMTLKLEQMTRKIKSYCVTAKYNVVGRQEPCLRSK